MNEHMKMESGCRVANLVDHPEFLKVTTIKAKFVDQMEKVVCPMPQDLKVVGATRAFVILQQKNGRLIRAHYTDWMEYLTFGVKDWQKARIEAGKQFDGYTQLFEN